MEVQSASCARADVQAAIDQANDGDIVSVPAGECAWTDTLRIAGGKALTLRGAGVDATVIVDKAPGGLIEMDTASGKPYRITGFTFRSSGLAKSGTEPRLINVTGYSHTVRIDGILFDHSLKTQPPNRAVIVNDDVLGVIDHCRFLSAGGHNANITIYHGKWGGVGQYGDASWADDAHWGSDRFVFIEDCVFEAPDGSHFFATDADAGARFVFRHNTLINANAATHGTETGGRRRGIRALEAYANVFRHVSRGNLGLIRSGSAVLFGNTAEGFNNLWAPVNNRSTHSFGVWKASDGANPFDTNDSRIYDEGVHDGPPSDNLIDSTKSWIDDEWAGRGLSVHNLTQTKGSYVVSNTATGIELAPSAFGGGLRFETGDKYRVLKCVFAMDAIGSGKGRLLSGHPPTPEEPVEQSRDPLYQWDNTLNGQPFAYGDFDNPHIVLGRDVINGPRPGYSPFAYPHPLTGEEAQDTAAPTPAPAPDPDPEPEPTPQPDPEPEPMEVHAASCARSDVQAAVDKANDGDVVTVPAGSCIWSDRVAIVNKALTLRGAGIDKTNIETAVSSGFNAALWLDSSKPVRVSGFTFTGKPGDKGVIRVAGEMTGWRVDHCAFRDLDGKPMDLLAGSGLVDHCEFTGAIRSTHILGRGDADWARPWVPGSDDAIFFEDNLWDKSNQSTIISCVEGGRYTFRHNRVVNGSISTHGADTAKRSGGIIECYGNDFTASTDQGRAIFMRGGTAVIFDNDFAGFRSSLISFANFRTCYDVSWVGVGQPENRSRCDGSQPIDGNEPIHAGGHTGTSGKTTLEDGSKNFKPDEFVGWHVWNLSDGSKGKISANDATTVTAQLSGGAANVWTTGDEYKICSGWPCKDQIGRGPGGEIGNQPSEPVYQWNNRWSQHGADPVAVKCFPSSGYTCDDPGVYDQIIEGRDYFDNVERPNYSPFTYPHPLTGTDPQDPVEPTPEPEPPPKPTPEPTPEPKDPVKEPDPAAKPDPPTGLTISEKGANAELMWDGSPTPSDFYRVWRSDSAGDLKTHATTAVPFFSESHPGRRGPWHYGVSVVVGGQESDISCCVVYRGK